MSTSWKAVLVTAPRCGPPSEERSHSIGSKTVNSAVPAAGDFEVVQVGQVAVAGVHAPDLLVGVVDDHLFALRRSPGG